MALKELITPIGIALVMIPIDALLLMISTKIFKVKDSSYKTAIKITAILGIASIILIVLGNFVPTIALYLTWISLVLVSIILAIWLIKVTYKLELGKSILVWLVWLVLSLVIAFVVAIVVAMILVTIGISTAV